MKRSSSRSSRSTSSRRNSCSKGTSNSNRSYSRGRHRLAGLSPRSPTSSKCVAGTNGRVGHLLNGDAPPAATADTNRVSQGAVPRPIRLPPPTGNTLEPALPGHGTNSRVKFAPGERLPGAARTSREFPSSTAPERTCGGTYLLAFDSVQKDEPVTGLLRPGKELMKRDNATLATSTAIENAPPPVSKNTSKSNGSRNGKAKAADGSLDLTVFLASLQTMRDGDFTVRLPGTWIGLAGKVADTFNEIVAANQHMAQELKRVGQVVGKQGKTRERTRFHESRGAWGEMEVSVNTLVEDLLRPTAEVTRAIAAVAQGDLTQTVRLDVDGRPLEGEFLRSANLVNTMIQQLSVFTAEVTRVAREVGTEGKLGGQAQVPDVAGTWKDLTDNVNLMASNLTGQVRNIAEVATAVASGDLSRKITVDVRGEILQLKEAINTMVDQLRSFASEVTRVAREVGTDGKLGGQAAVPGVAGTWKDLTDSVNAMAGNLTAQVRNIAEVTTA